MPNIDASVLTNLKTNLDVAWVKIQDALHQEAEGCDLWIEGTIELINILHDARERFDSDQAFGRWLLDTGYSERITRHDRQALLNMALDLNVTRDVLRQTERRSWQHIWTEEVQPRLPYVRQPADDQKSEETKPNTRRPKKGDGTKKPTAEWGKDLKDFLSDGLLAANALVRIKRSIQQCSPEKQAEVKKKVTPEWSDKIDEGSKAGAWICDWTNGLLEEDANALILEGRVKTTPARAAKQVRPEA